MMKLYVCYIQKKSSVSSSFKEKKDNLFKMKKKERRKLR